MTTTERLGRKLRKLRKQALTRTLRWSPDIPVLVICRDRLDPLEKLVTWLEAEGMRRVVLLDNDSTYPPLLDWYETTQHTVVRLGRNVGHTSPWLPEVQAEHVGDLPFVVTDPDVVPDPSAHGCVERMVRILNRNPDFVKVGLGLHIDDLPDHYRPRADVIALESAYWEHPIDTDLFKAPVDTTFALHRPGTDYTLWPALRTGGRDQARHLAWYVDSDRPDAETRFYVARASASLTWGTDDAAVRRADDGAWHRVERDPS